jgi:uncharacterized membrane protein YoaK (UPF0700 family)
MMNVSNARKLSALARVAAQRAGRTRTGNAVLRGIRATASHFGHVVRQLWLEVTGFVFLVLAAVGAGAFAREYTKYQAGQASVSRLIIAICFTGMFGWFGLNSFWRVRKKG